MTMRHWLNTVRMLIEDVVDEAAEMVGDPPYRVIRNPTAKAVINLVKRSRDRILKGLYDPTTNTLYVWDAYLAAHATVEYDLALPYAEQGMDPVALIIGLKGDGQLALHVCDERATDRVKAHPSLRAIDFADPDAALHKRWQ